jgi:hypothetical protein
MEGVRRSKLALNDLPEQCAFPASSVQPMVLFHVGLVYGRLRCRLKWNCLLGRNALATKGNKRSRGMKVTGLCNICGREQEDIPHVLFWCTHAYSLWATMRKLWLLPSHLDIQVNPSQWMQSMLISMPPQIIENFLLVKWWAWYCRNEVTHAKPLPSVEGPKRFLSGYVNMIKGLKSMTTDQLLKGKNTLLVGETSVVLDRPKAPHDKSWEKPSQGWLKLNIDGSYQP